MYLKNRERQKDFFKTIQDYRKNAERGNAQAQYVLGWIYREGAGLAVNPREALSWYHKAARQGNTNAQLALGDIYLQGKMAPVNSGEALQWYFKSAEKEIRARVKLYKLYQGAGGISKNEEEEKKWADALTRSTDESLRAYIRTQHAILNTEQERNPLRALRACRRIFDVEPADKTVSDTCEALHQQMRETMLSRIQKTKTALEQKDWNKFRDLLSELLTPDFDEMQLRRLIASAWRLIEEESRSQEKTAQNLLSSLESAERSAAYRRRHAQQIPHFINAFQATVNQGLTDNPGDENLAALALKGRKVIASLRQKMRPPRLVKEKKEEKDAADSPEAMQENAEPGEEDYKKAQELFNGGQFEAASQIFEKTIKIRGSKYIASAYIYLGITNLARINPANINEARKLRLQGLGCFQNALRFDDSIGLPSGYDKYQPVFEEAKKRLR